MGDDEQWRPISGYEGIYEVSNHGRVRSLDRVSAQGGRLTGRLRKPDAVTSRSGHLRVALCRDGKVRRWFVHRLVLTAFLGAPSIEMQACHNDGDPTNNVLTNLRWDTASANARDRLRHGTNDRANRTHCPQGHEYERSNTYFTARGWRLCRTCRLTRERAKRIQAKERSA